MTLADLQEQCWASLPPLRKRIVGRDTVNDFVALAVENWESEYLNACVDNAQRDVYAGVIAGHIKRVHQAGSRHEPQEYGFIWVFLLQAVAVSVVQYLIKWWLEKRSNRVFMAAWKTELTR